MKKNVLFIMLMFITISADIRVTKYTDSFGDKTGEQIVVLTGSLISESSDNIGKIIIEKDGSLQYRTTQYLTTHIGWKLIGFKDNFGDSLFFSIQTANLGNNRQSYSLSNKPTVEKRDDTSDVIVFDTTIENISLKYRLKGNFTSDLLPQPGDIYDTVITRKYNISWAFDTIPSQSEQVIKMLKKSSWVKVVVWDYTGAPVVSKIFTNGFTKTLKETFGY